MTVTNWCSNDHRHTSHIYRGKKEVRFERRRMRKKKEREGNKSKCIRRLLCFWGTINENLISWLALSFLFALLWLFLCSSWGCKKKEQHSLDLYSWCEMRKKETDKSWNEEEEEDTERGGEGAARTSSAKRLKSLLVVVLRNFRRLASMSQKGRALFRFHRKKIPYDSGNRSDPIFPLL